jgi:hypothetical protein
MDSITTDAQILFAMNVFEAGKLPLGEGCTNYRFLTGLFMNCFR